jgi:hypothetical protein
MLKANELSPAVPKSDASVSYWHMALRCRDVGDPRTAHTQAEEHERNRTAPRRVESGNPPKVQTTWSTLDRLTA